MKVSQLKEQLARDFKDDDEIAYTIWNREDVKSRAQQLGPDITDETADAILERMHLKQDCCIGLTWDTIDFYLQQEREP